MTAAELMHHNFDEIFIELDPVKREAMMRDAYTEDCVWIHPGGRLVGIAAVNQAASEIRSASRSTATRWLAMFARCTMSGCAVGGADSPTNRSATSVRTFWRNVAAASLCSTPSSIVELRQSRRRNKVFAWMENVADAEERRSIPAGLLLGRRWSAQLKPFAAFRGELGS
jgi:hypothetical protein